MSFLFLLNLSFQCMLNTLSQASSYDINPGWKWVQSRPAPKSHLRKFLTEALRDNPDYIDSRLLALSWIESRIRPSVRRGDKGQACGMFQIHARYSHPMFRRKRGFVDWEESKEKLTIRRECIKLENISYSIETMEKLLGLMDKKDLHPCHHNSGFYGRCNTWYKDRLDYWMTYFDLANLVCNERTIEIMAMMRTGNPIPTAPSNLMQGYLDAMAGKEPQLTDSVYKSGYDLAKLVQEGKAQAPAWAVENKKTSTQVEGEREG